ncbi:hypothetical protein BpOF4_17080 [Alkalihalophilus pseudofirmus OF4]|uniref:Uncharacterized protein n=2 Tax=Alkalihalophilus pseudofirmus TaxID=79885 RepID=D3FQT9_ALKPO|nr:hypothetical protein BpOF4_17080 [Alkalihalophilus pseudofirmus OF4]
MLACKNIPGTELSTVAEHSHSPFTGIGVAVDVILMTGLTLIVGFAVFVLEGLFSISFLFFMGQQHDTHLQ